MTWLIHDLPKEHDLGPLVIGWEDGTYRRAADLEAELIARLQSTREEPEPVQLRLAELYGLTRNFALAEAYTEDLLAGAKDDETRARLFLRLGQMAEARGRFDSAVTHYRRSLQYDPGDQFVLYFARNNLGYSLNQQGKFQEAEQLCRLAIAVDHGRYNAHKNLGIALEGQGRLVEAAQAFLDAARRSTTDGRSLGHLVSLIERHPNLAKLVGDLSPYQEVVEAAARRTESFQQRALEDVRRQFPSASQAPASDSAA